MLYVKKEPDKSTLFTGLYVNDLIIFIENNLSTFKTLKENMIEEFKMKNISFMTYFLGIEVT